MGIFDGLKRRTDKQVKGEAGEDQAAGHLQKHGLRLLERNFRCKGGEIDLIMQDRDCLVFVEVRKRAQAVERAQFGGAAASITPAKQRRLILAAQVYLKRYVHPPPCRFDVVAIDGAQLEWLKNAIEA